MKSTVILTSVAVCVLATGCADKCVDRIANLSIDAVDYDENSETLVLSGYSRLSYCSDAQGDQKDYGNLTFTLALPSGEVDQDQTRTASRKATRLKAPYRPLLGGIFSSQCHDCGLAMTTTDGKYEIAFDTRTANLEAYDADGGQLPVMLIGVSQQGQPAQQFAVPGFDDIRNLAE